MPGLNGKADKSKSGFIKRTELVDYVDNEVPSLAEKVFKKSPVPDDFHQRPGVPDWKSEIAESEKIVES